MAVILAGLLTALRALMVRDKLAERLLEQGTISRDLTVNDHLPSQAQGDGPAPDKQQHPLESCCLRNVADAA
ncbi:hypothetical protein CKO42_00465 [Lamprobacter modestohalophilus]|uniref:Uncharacterized protein n=1 Tax=Lamprobacter modestohalophilus TaxID=1064514 RepID=A0A9X0W4R3_9GAMM|nr:hypothetical protein [Lamprobacter modestohalophilus]MBK1616943.1 hypothetical protein [Lamprobacter modestohalophilus]